MTTRSDEIPAVPPGTRLTVFENGLTVITREDHSAPVVSAQAWCKAGSIDEGNWLGAGLSHMLEHMLFKGTTTRGAGRIDQEVQDAGGYMNAYTSFDRTVYYINVPNTGAGIAVDILCDIMQNATLPPEETAKEKEVILREMDMNQDDPGRRSSRRLFETAYTRSPYRYTVIGYPDIFREVQREDVLAYYREKYRPNNIFFVIVGDISGEQVEEQIRSAFAQAKARPLPPGPPPVEPRQAGPRELLEYAPIQLGHVHFAWHTPDIRHPDIPALEMLSAVLGAGHSSRLYQEVRERQGCVHYVDAWTYNPGNPGLFGMSAVVETAQFETACQAMLAEVDRMKQSLITPAELSKAIKMFTASILATRKTMQGQAQDLGSNWMAAGDLNFSERFLAAAQRVTPEQIQQAAREYLTLENRTLYGLLPIDGERKVSIGASAIVEAPTQKITLANGLRLLLKEDHRLPFVQFRMVFRGGVLSETPENNGITALLSKMLLKGTHTRSAEQIVTEIESVGGSIDTYGGNNSFGVSAEVLSSDFACGLELMADVLLNSAFPENALERERITQLAGIRATKDQMLQSAVLAMRRALFGERSYGLDVNGTEASVAAIQPAALKEFFAKCAVPKNCVLAVFGDITPAKVQEAVEAVFAKWQGGLGEESIETVGTVAPSGVLRPVEWREKKQAVLVIGFRGITLSNPDRFPLELLQEALSDLGSRLFLRIREELGLAYYVGAQNFLGLHPGYFALYAGTAPESAQEVEAELLKEVEALRRDGLTEIELKRAKAKVIGQKKISRQDLGSCAMASALDELYGLGYGHSDEEDAFYEAVTLDDVRRVARTYLTPDSMVVAIATPGNGEMAGQPETAVAQSK